MLVECHLFLKTASQLLLCILRLMMTQRSDHFSCWCLVTSGVRNVVMLLVVPNFIILPKNNNKILHSTIIY